jgi:hypothetical protein
MQMTKTKKLTFAYLYYTRTPSFGNEPVLIGVFRSKTAAKSHMLLVHGDDVPVGDNGGKRVVQKINKVTGQIWYVEKHVMKDGR